MGLPLGSSCTCVPLTGSALDWTGWGKADFAVCCLSSVFRGLQGFSVGSCCTSDSLEQGTVTLEDCGKNLFGSSTREKKDETYILILSRRKRMKALCISYYHLIHLFLQQKKKPGVKLLIDFFFIQYFKLFQHLIPGALAIYFRYFPTFL